MAALKEIWVVARDKSRATALFNTTARTLSAGTEIFRRHGNGRTNSYYATAGDTKPVVARRPQRNLLSGQTKW